MGHSKPRLTPFSRRVLVDRVVIDGMPAAHAAAMMGISRATAYKWVRRFRLEGYVGLEDRPSRPHHTPHALSRRDVERVLRARRRLGYGPHRLGPHLGMARSTVYGVLRRNGVSRLDHLDRPTRVPVRYCRERPGELVHLDVKKLGRIPAGGGHRMVGRFEGKKNRGYRRHTRLGSDYLHVAVDDCSRVAFVQIHADERGPTCTRFLLDAAAHFAEHGVKIDQVMTDNARNYTIHKGFQRALPVLALSTS